MSIKEEFKNLDDVMKRKKLKIIAEELKGIAKLDIKVDTVEQLSREDVYTDIQKPAGKELPTLDEVMENILTRKPINMSPIHICNGKTTTSAPTQDEINTLIRKDDSSLIPIKIDDDIHGYCHIDMDHFKSKENEDTIEIKEDDDILVLVFENGMAEHVLFISASEYNLSIDANMLLYDYDENKINNYISSNHEHIDFNPECTSKYDDLIEHLHHEYKTKLEIQSRYLDYDSGGLYPKPHYITTEIDPVSIFGKLSIDLETWGKYPPDTDGDRLVLLDVDEYPKQHNSIDCDKHNFDGDVVINKHNPVIYKRLKYKKRVKNRQKLYNKRKRMGRGL